MDESIHLPACNEVLSTCDVYHVINSTRLSHFLSIFCSRARRTWDEAIFIYDYTKTNKKQTKKRGRPENEARHSQEIVREANHPYHWSLNISRKCRIAENFRGRKLSKLVKNTIFVEKTFTYCSLCHAQTIEVQRINF